jgi:predicted nucleotidyltransferase
LRGLAVYGSAVSGDAIPGLSDLDLFVVLTDELTLADAIALQR